ncbi:unnamed protein product [Owenia fusiformis]|uniref:EamA domain-containing protein n=1 Tax=Owenia fusiformis TaxID=6347 RepID=A0A8J1Y7P4_OWEFU|nr:unnamed protein product [Owenia fusiformis]
MTRSDTRSVLFAISIGVLTSICKVLIGLTLQEINEKRITNFELGFLRMIIQLLIGSIWLYKTQHNETGSEYINYQNGSVDLLNSTLYCVSNYFFLLGLRSGAGMGDLYSLISSTRIIMVVIFARIFIKEPIHFILVISVVICLLGNIAITQPDIIFQTANLGILLRPLWNNSENFEQNITSKHDILESPIWPGYIAAATGATCRALTVIITRWSLHEKTISTTARISEARLVFNIAAIGVLFYGTGCFFQGFYFPDNLHDIICVLGYAISSAPYIICYVMTLKLLPASAAAIIFSLSIVFGTLFQYTLFTKTHKGNSNILEIVGVVLVLIGVTIMPLRQICQSEQIVEKSLQKHQIISKDATKNSLPKKRFYFPQSIK